MCLIQPPLMANAEILTDPGQNWVLPSFNEWLQINEIVSLSHANRSVCGPTAIISSYENKQSKVHFMIHNYQIKCKLNPPLHFSVIIPL